MKMLLNSNESISGQLNPVDRLSDLPDYTIQHIISFLGSAEAYRTCILSKRWSHIPATNPVVSFGHDNLCKETLADCLECIEYKMQRHSKDNLRIRKLHLSFAFDDVTDVLASKFDEWLGIAVHNQVAELTLVGPGNYQLPDILLSAKSLTILDCSWLKMPCYKPINFVLLNCLSLDTVVVEEHMINHIISSCMLLKHLGITDCSGFKSIVIPRSCKLESLYLINAIPIGGTVFLETPSLESFQFVANDNQHWPVISKAGLLRNLRALEIFYADITDKVLDKLLAEVTLLETLIFGGCVKVSNFRISSAHLKEICLENCCELSNVTINAPSLKKFTYIGDMGDLNPDLSITINCQNSCDVYVHTEPYNLGTGGFCQLKKTLTGLSSCNVLKIVLVDDRYQSDGMQFDEKLWNIHLGPPCDVRELKLVLSSWILPESSISAFLDGLFWICHPDIISMRVDLRDPNVTVEALMSKLEKMAKCWKHPLKGIEVEGSNCCKLLKAREIDVQLRLYW